MLIHRFLLMLLVSCVVGLLACGPLDAVATPPPSTTAPVLRPKDGNTPAPAAPISAASPAPPASPSPTATARPSPTPLPASSPSGGPAPAAGQLRLDVAQGTVARYLVQEQLAGANLPNDAVGVTSAVTGQVLLGPDGAVHSDQSRFTVDLTTLKSDDSRRDNYLRRSTLETSRFPKAEFVLQEVRGLALPLPVGAEAQFQLLGDLTVHGVTSSVVWNATGAFTAEGVTGKAATSFPFRQFGMSVPRVFVVVSVEDNIRLEVDFRLVRAG